MFACYAFHHVRTCSSPPSLCVWASCAVHVWAWCARQLQLSIGWGMRTVRVLFVPSCILWCLCSCTPRFPRSLIWRPRSLACMHGFVSGVCFWFSFLFGCRTFLGKTNSGQGFPNWIQEETNPHRTDHGLEYFGVSCLCFRRRAELPVDTGSLEWFQNFQSYQDQLCRVPPMTSFTFQFCRLNNDTVSRFQEIEVDPFPFVNFWRLIVSHFQLSQNRSWCGFIVLVSQVFRISLKSNVRTFAFLSSWDSAFYESSCFEVLEPSALKVLGSSIFFKCTDCKIPWLWRCVISVLCKLTLPKCLVSQFLYFRDFAFLCNLTPPKILYSQFLHSRDVTFLWNLTFPAFTDTQFLHFRDVQFLWNSRHPKSRCLQFLHFPGFPISVKSHNFRKSVFDSFSLFVNFSISGKSNTCKTSVFAVFATCWIFRFCESSHFPGSWIHSFYVFWMLRFCEIPHHRHRWIHSFHILGTLHFCEIAHFRNLWIHGFHIFGLSHFTISRCRGWCNCKILAFTILWFFIKRTYRRRDFCCLRFFASSEFSRYKKLVSAFPRFSKDDIFQSFSFAILQVVVFHVSGFLSSQLSWFSLSLGPEGTLLYIRDWLPYTCVGCRLRGSASSCI